jgi:uncharacterized membrane protein
MDTQSRSIVKAILWNLIGFLMMSAVGIVATGSVSLGSTLALVNTALGFLSYVIYERIWARVRWGRHV